MSTEKIEVWYKPLDRLGLFHHKYIVYTDKNGVRHMAHGGEGTDGDIATYHGRAWSNDDLYRLERAERMTDRRDLIIEEKDPDKDLLGNL